MRRILDSIGSGQAFSQTLQGVKERSVVHLRGLAGSLRSLVPALLYQRTSRPLLMVFEDRADADSTYADLATLLGPDHALLYQESHHTTATISDTLDAEVVSLTDALKSLADRPDRVVVTDVETLAAHVPTARNITGHILPLKVGDRVGFEEFTLRLAKGGFERTDIVESVGTYAVRGGIIDIFPVGVDNPVRVEFFGDEIDSMREFDPASQRSIRDFASINLMAKLFHSEDEDQLTATILEHLPPNAIFFLEEPERIFGLLEDAGQQAMIPRIESHTLLTHSQVPPQDAQVIEFGGRAQPPVQSSLKELCKVIEQLRDSKQRLFLLADGDDARRRLNDLIDGEHDRAADEDHPYNFAATDLLYLNETLSHGFVLPAQNLAVFVEHEIFSRQRSRARVVRRKQFKGFTLRELKQLRPGDYVVHVDKGIGRFVGLESITAAGQRGEAVKLEYASGDILFVNLNYINRLQKYSSKEGAMPKLSKLGTDEWERAKARAKRRVKDIARELIRLYAIRKSQPGMQFPPDTSWQRELEASFMYEDTPDQASATVAVKRDMESATPMDRLVCGDVGFGKTEVAVRAAFKAVQGGKQVAILAPTTILAQQHFNTFRDRLSRYAVNVGLLSRFRTKAEQKETIEGLKRGVVDVLIGTHRILSKDVVFKDVGLLIVDEEQRFGVAAKEKLRQLRANIDTLTLTATPIPRTLNFSLMGARDLSVIETPPRNRLPIQTELMRWNDEAVAEAVTRELRRGGQCFVVHWRIGDLDELAAKIHDLVPEARVITAHGEMPAEQLENTMMKFIERQFNVLVTTKIVESGLDIPSANTMIVNHADKFGLAELYQLRGRVGRSNIQAYCYMIVPPPTAMSRVALKRLQAIAELSELGSGIRLAMRDMEIRGAGNLLGAEQSGFIEEVGFDLYQRIVDEAVEELKREEFRDLFRDQIEEKERATLLPNNEDLQIETEGDALIPKKYIREDSERYEVYLRLYTAGNLIALQKVISEIRDRFGKMPPETENLLDALRLRLAGMETGAARLSLRQWVMRLELPPQSNQEFYDRWFQPLMYAANHSPFVQLETKGKLLALRFDRINTVEEAENALAAFKDAMMEQRMARTTSGA